MDIIDRIFEFLLKGNTKAKIAIIASFAIFLKMLYDLFGLEYLSMTTDEMSEDLGMGIAIGEVLPFDIGTLLIGGIVIWLANYGIEHSKEGMKLAKIAKVGAIIIMLLSFTPIPVGLSMIPRAIVTASDSGKLYDSAQHYEEFIQYVDVSRSIALTDGAQKSEIQSYLEENLTELGKQAVKSIAVEEIRDHIQITLEFHDSKKYDLIYSMEVEELDYPTAYYQWKYNGKTVIGCKEEKDYAYAIEIGNAIIRYPTMMFHDHPGVDRIYATAQSEEGNAINYAVLFESASIYRGLVPQLYNNVPSQVTALPNYCKELVYQICNYFPGKGSQTIETSETVVVNGITMQRATGDLWGEIYGGNGAVEAYRYVAYYFFVEQDGKNWPVVMLGITNPEIIDVLEEYMYEAVEYVEFRGEESVDATEF